MISNSERSGRPRSNSLRIGICSPSWKISVEFDGVPASGAAADVGIVGDAGGEAEQAVLMEDRPEEEDVREVHAAVVGIVHDEHVAGMDVVGIFPHQRRDGVGDGAEMHRHAEPLGDQPAAGVAEAGGEVHAFPHHLRVGGAHDRDRHLVGEIAEAVLDHLEGHRVGEGSEPACPLFLRPRRRCCPIDRDGRGCAAARRVVPSMSSMISGPSVGCRRELTARDHRRIETAERRSEIGGACARCRRRTRR